MRNWFVYIFSLSIIVLIGLNSCQNEKQIEYQRYYVAGKRVFENNCQNCHNNDGSGLGALIPPLTDSAFLVRNKLQIACIIKNGLSGNIIVNGKSYDGEMPAHDRLSDIEIAEVITYITNSFGNNQGAYSTESVNKDLKNCN